jgi:hypothetical protein
LAFYLGRKADYSPLSSAEVKEWAELYLHSPNTSSWRGAWLGGAQGQPYLYLFTLICCVCGKYLHLRCYWPSWPLPAQEGEEIYFWNGSTLEADYSTSDKEKTARMVARWGALLTVAPCHSGALAFSTTPKGFHKEDTICAQQNLHEIWVGIKLQALWMSLVFYPQTTYI